MKKFANWFSSGEQYLKTSKLIMAQTIENNNSWTIVKDYNFEPSEYDKWTERSDFNTFVLALFLMLHGYELIIKGILIWSGKNIDKTHDVAGMLKLLESDPSIDNELIKILNKYIGNNIKNEVLKRFLLSNSQLKSNNLHVDIRYPESHGKPVDFTSMRFREEDLIVHLNEIVFDIDMVLKISIKMIRSNEKYMTNIS